MYNLGFEKRGYMSSEKAGRNDPCPCGLGKKYKNCCMQKEQQKNRTQLTSLGKRKFTAKVLSSGGTQKSVEQPQEQQKAAIDYSTLMERSFGNAIHNEEPPPVPSNFDQYLIKKSDSNSPTN